MEAYNNMFKKENITIREVISPATLRKYNSICDQIIGSARQMKKKGPRGAEVYYDTIKALVEKAADIYDIWEKNR